MNIKLSERSPKQEVLEEVENYLAKQNFKLARKNLGLPWGGFFVLDESQAEQFGKLFFPDLKISDLKISGKLSPKILVVESGKRLSWQYHHRRAEIWKLIAGSAGVATSLTDEEGPVNPMALQDVVRLKQGERHRLVGLNNWGIVAEIWQHTDAQHPSDENDIVRLQDDFGRW
ncbi:MAG TPA: phosphoheptose isomerase [Cyclobacteriaceae bacterium]|jgi:mannose-6-phosphate isomerase-like protein (cupin superfamily)|nr:phosphoheptose isomerase [Cyclobacteriaceae bacterium]